MNKVSLQARDHNPHLSQLKRECESVFIFLYNSELYVIEGVPKKMGMAFLVFFD